MIDDTRDVTPTDNELKQCKDCLEHKPLERFYNQSGRQSHTKHPYCKPCHGKRNRGYQRQLHGPTGIPRTTIYSAKYNAGVSSELLARLRALGVCELCGKSISGRQVHIDHDHQTGEIRGALCANCNTAIGKLGDTVEALERALAYLRQPPKY